MSKEKVRLTYGFSEYRWDYLLQGITVNMHSWVNVHLNQPNLHILIDHKVETINVKKSETRLQLVSYGVKTILHYTLNLLL